MNEEHVELVAEGLTEVRPNSIVTSSGREIECDVIAYCTGYRILDFDRIEVTGQNGESLAKVMHEAPEAHKGISVPNFPNFFFAVGPNGLVLNVPYFMTVEQNVATIVRLLKEKQSAGVKGHFSEGRSESGVQRLATPTASRSIPGATALATAITASTMDAHRFCSRVTSRCTRSYRTRAASRTTRPLRRLR